MGLENMCQALAEEWVGLQYLLNPEALEVLRGGIRSLIRETDPARAASAAEQVAELLVMALPEDHAVRQALRQADAPTPPTSHQGRHERPDPTWRDALQSCLLHPANDIHIHVSHFWMEPRFVQDFVIDLLNDPDITATRTPDKGWIITANDTTSTANRDYGTPRLTTLNVLENMLNLHPIVVRTQAPKEESRQDREVRKQDDERESQAASDRADALKRRFAEWIWQTPERASVVMNTYTSLFARHAQRASAYGRDTARAAAHLAELDFPTFGQPVRHVEPETNVGRKRPPVRQQDLGRHRNGPHL